MRNAHCRNRNMARNLKIIENEKNTLYYLDYGEESEIGQK